LLHIYRFGLLMVGLMLLVSGCGVPGTVQALSPAGTQAPMSMPVGSAQAQTPETSAEAQAAGTPAGQGPSEEQLKLWLM